MDRDLDDDRIRGYLLADLPEEERDRLEADFFRDDDLFDRLRATEDDLVDDYVTGALSDKARRQFSEHYLTSPERQRKVALARALQRATTVPAEPARTSVLETLAALLGINRPALRLVFAAASLAAILLGTLMWERSQFGQPQGRVALQDTVGPATLIGEETVLLAALGPLPASLSQSVREFITTGTVVLDIRAETARNILQDATRGTRLSGQGGSTPALVPLSPTLTAIRTVEPTLRWQGAPNAREYHVVVADQDGKIVWQASTGGETQVTLPVAGLERGRTYLWQVEAVADGNSTRAAAVGFWVIDDQTLHDIEAVEKSYPASALILAATYTSRGLFEDALTQVDRLAALNPSSADVQLMRTRLLRLLGRP